MALPDKFPEVLLAVLAKMLPDEQTRAAVGALIDVHREKIRRICCAPSRMGIRVAEMAKADDELLEALEALANTEHDLDAPGNSPTAVE